jgi:hypothetical protein
MQLNDKTFKIEIHAAAAADSESIFSKLQVPLATS